MNDIRIVRSNRRTLAIQVSSAGICVRAPVFVSDKQIDEFIKKNSEWISIQLQKIKKRTKNISPEDMLSSEDICSLVKKAEEIIPRKVEYYAGIIGVTYGKITIRNQSTRWGSCSSKGNLNFNCLLMLAPDRVLDSVIVHELCHRREMNHSQRFYDEILRVFPDYYLQKAWLEKNGASLMLRAGK